MDSSALFFGEFIWNTCNFHFEYMDLLFHLYPLEQPRYSNATSQYLRNSNDLGRCDMYLTTMPQNPSFPLKHYISEISTVVFTWHDNRSAYSNICANYTMLGLHVVEFLSIYHQKLPTAVKAQNKVVAFELSTKIVHCIFVEDWPSWRLTDATRICTLNI